MAVYLALVHYPVYNRNNEVIATAITNLDIHDIARVASTFGVAGYFLVHPEESQKNLAQEILDFWQTGVGSDYNPDRAIAFRLITLKDSVEDCKKEIQAISGNLPKIVVTSARKDYGKEIDYQTLREKIENTTEDYLILFGTGWGLTKEIMESADYRLPPIMGAGEYNHLSVRAAVAIICDRLFGK